MGLDQNWLVKIGENDEGEPEYAEIAYHRKFNALEGFMSERWAEKSGQSAEEFNCEYLTITPEILDKLEATIKEDKLEPTPGFFFGTYEKDEWYRKDVENLVQEVLPKVREHLKDGDHVVYTSWW